MAQSRELATLSEDMRSVPSTYLRQLTTACTTCKSSHKGSGNLFWLLQVYKPHTGTRMCAHVCVRMHILTPII